MRSHPSTCAMLAAALLLSACGGRDVTGPGTGPGPGVNGTTIAATVSAAGFRDVSYVWSLDAVPPSDTMVLAQGASSLVTFAVDVTRSESISLAGARGEVCVDNVGGHNTQALAVAARVQVLVGDVFEDVSGASQAVQVGQQIAGGQSSCFPFEVAFDRDDAAEYRVVADVSIGNHGVSSPTSGGISVAGTVGSFAEASVDGGAELSGEIACPAGYDCTPAATSWSLGGSASLGFEITIVNNDAACGEAVELGSSLLLVEGMSAGTHTAGGAAVIMGGPCACTQRAGYWKDNSGANGSPDLVTEHLPIWLGTANGAASIEVASAAQAASILTAAAGSNAIPKLQRQLLAARLNIAGSTSDAAVDAVIADADAFLAQHDASAWSSLTQSQMDEVEAMKDALDDYNSGVTGPGACS